MQALLAKLKSVLAYLPASLRTAVVHMLTGRDNQTFSAVHLGVFGGVVSMIGVFVYLAVSHGTADYGQFGAGLGLLLVGAGHGIAKSDPPSEGQ